MVLDCLVLMENRASVGLPALSRTEPSTVDVTATSTGNLVSNAETLKESVAVGRLGPVMPPAPRMTGFIQHGHPKVM